jgi:hypothetical protein
LIFEPLTLLEKLAALTTRPRINLVLYHGVLAPHSGWRARVVADGALAGEALMAASASADANGEPPPGCRHYAWAALMRRAFDLDALVCPRCGGRLRLLGTVEDPDAIRAILAAVAVSGELADRVPPTGAAQTPSPGAAISA